MNFFSQLKVGILLYIVTPVDLLPPLETRIYYVHNYILFYISTYNIILYLIIILYHYLLQYAISSNNQNYSFIAIFIRKKISHTKI